MAHATGEQVHRFQREDFDFRFTVTVPAGITAINVEEAICRFATVEKKTADGVTVSDETPNIIVTVPIAEADTETLTPAVYALELVLIVNGERATVAAHSFRLQQTLIGAVA